ncbi:YraN family protein [Devosia sp.]|uniref:YraN family protein n=1 Tax=Devosia sp. TaxID=1871048 RepID=UPI002EFE0377
MPPSPSRPPGASPRDPRRLAAELFGRRGEAVAAWYLRAKLYRIVARRLKTPVGEIDLVAMHLGTLVFVEVKARRRRGDEFDALLHVNRRRLLRAAQYYLLRNPRLAELPMRFDVIFLAPLTWPRHVRNAFDASRSDFHAA